MVSGNSLELKELEERHLIVMAFLLVALGGVGEEERV